MDRISDSGSDDVGSIPAEITFKSTKHSGIEVYPDERSDIGNSRRDHQDSQRRFLKKHLVALDDFS